MLRLATGTWLVAASLSLACQSTTSADRDPVVLSLGDQSVRRSAFEHHVAELELPEQVGVDVAVERALFDVFVEEQLLLLAARERGLVSPDADQGASETAVRRLVAEIAGGVPAVGDTDARRYYEAHLDEFQAREMVALRQILVVTLNEARDVRRRLTADPKSFEMLARRLSRGPEASEGGRMGTFARGELPVDLESAAFGLRVGGTSGIIESALGFHVLRVDERQEPHSRSFEQCRDEIVARLEQTRADGAVRAFVRSLRARAEVNHDAATHPVLDRS